MSGLGVSPAPELATKQFISIRCPSSKQWSTSIFRKCSRTNWLTSTLRAGTDGRDRPDGQRTRADRL